MTPFRQTPDGRTGRVHSISEYERRKPSRDFLDSTLSRMYSASGYLPDGGTPWSMAWASSCTAVPYSFPLPQISSDPDSWSITVCSSKRITEWTPTFCFLTV